MADGKSGGTILCARIKRTSLARLLATHYRRLRLTRFQSQKRMVFMPARWMGAQSLFCNTLRAQPESRRELSYNFERSSKTLPIRTAFRHDSGCVGVNWLPLYHNMGLIEPNLSTLDFLRSSCRRSHLCNVPSGGCARSNYGYQLCIERRRGADQSRPAKLASCVLWCGADTHGDSTIFHRKIRALRFSRH
jgi:hypothetical protein